MNELTVDEKLNQYKAFNNGVMTYKMDIPLEPELELDNSLTGDIDGTIGLTKPKVKTKPKVDKEDFLKIEDDPFPGIKQLSNANELLEYKPKDTTDGGFDFPTGKRRKFLDFAPFEQTIRIKESDNIPTAKNPKSSAVGYYQFLWGSWGDDIKKVTGVKDVEEYKQKPDAQKQYFKYYFDKHIVPGVKNIKDTIGDGGLSDFDLGQLIHFRGLGGAKKLIKSGELNKKQEAYNPTAIEYIKR